MRRSYAKTFGELEDKPIPSKEYLEKKLHELENGEFRAEAQTEVVSRDEVDPDTLMPVWGAKGHITVKRGNTTVALPAGPEQLRMRLAVMANALIMMKMKHAPRNELKDITPAFFEKYKDYLLVDYVCGLRASDDYGGTMLPWTLVLSYEHAIRKHCYKIMAQLKLALEKSWKDDTVSRRDISQPPWPSMLREDTLRHPQQLRLPLATRAAKARIRARARARRDIPELPLTS